MLSLVPLGVPLLSLIGLVVLDAKSVDHHTGVVVLRRQAQHS